MCVCWVSVDCEEPVTIKQPPATEAPHDYKGEEEVSYQNAVSILYTLGLRLGKYGGLFC